MAEFDSVATIDRPGAGAERLWATQPSASATAWPRPATGRRKRWDLVFNIAEGLCGRSREAQVPALLEMYGIPYTFSDPLVCALTLDKAMTKRVVHRRVCVRRGSASSRRSRTISQSSTSAIRCSPNPWRKARAKEWTAVPRRIAPRRCQGLCPPAGAFPPAGPGGGIPARPRVHHGHPGHGSRGARPRDDGNSPSAPTRRPQDYSYEVKEQCEQYVDYFPMPTGPCASEVEALALRAYRVLECRDTGRVDIRLDAQGRPAFMEINPLPGTAPPRIPTCP